MTEEIKSCPVCGSENLYCEWISENVIVVHCDDCNKRPYDFDMPAIVKKVQQLERQIKQLKAMLKLGVNYERANG